MICVLFYPHHSCELKMCVCICENVSTDMYLFLSSDAKVNIRDYHGKMAAQYWNGTMDIFYKYGSHSGKQTSVYYLPYEFSLQFYVDNIKIGQHQVLKWLFEVTDSCFTPISRQMVRRGACPALRSIVCLSVTESREHQCGDVCS